MIAFDNDLRFRTDFLPLLGLLLGGVKKPVSASCSELSEIKVSIILEALDRTWCTHFNTNASASVSFEAFRLHNVLSAFT